MSDNIFIGSCQVIMDKPLVALENKLNLNDKDKSIMTIAVHTNPNNTNLLTVNQMENYFIPRLRAMNCGKHDYDNDIDGVENYKKGIITYFGSEFYNQIRFGSYSIVKSSYNHLKELVHDFYARYAKEYNLPLLAIINPQLYKYRHKNVYQHLSYQKQLSLFYVFDNEPKDVKLASDVLGTNNSIYDCTYSRLNILKFLEYFKKNPNTKFIPDPDASMADPFGIPDGMTPNECIKNTKKYIRSLSRKILMTPKQVINYCNIHLDHLNNQIKAVAKRHPYIHYKKFLSNDLLKLEHITNTAFNSPKYKDNIRSTVISSSAVDKVNNYHWVLNQLALYKMSYINLLLEQEYQLDHGNPCGSFADDVLGNNFDYEDKTLHQLSSINSVSDYLRFN